MIKGILVSCLGVMLSVSLMAEAVTSKEIGIKGYVTSFDTEKIVIESGTQKIEIPKALYKEKVKVGELISVKIDEANLAKLKKTAIAPAKKDATKK